MVSTLLYECKNYDEAFNELIKNGTTELEKSTGADDFENSISIFHDAADLAKNRGKTEDYVHAKYLEGQSMFLKNKAESLQYTNDSGLPISNSSLVNAFAESRAVLNEVLLDSKYEDCKYYPNTAWAYAVILSETGDYSKSTWETLAKAMISAYDSLDINNLTKNDAVNLMNYGTQIAVYYMKFYPDSETDEERSKRFKKILVYLDTNRECLTSEDIFGDVLYHADSLVTNLIMTSNVYEEISDATGDVKYLSKALSMLNTAIEKTSKAKFDRTAYVQLKLERCEVMTNYIDYCFHSSNLGNAEELNNYAKQIYDDASSLTSEKSTYTLNLRNQAMANFYIVFSGLFSDDELSNAFDCYNEYFNYLVTNSSDETVNYEAAELLQLCFSCQCLWDNGYRQDYIVTLDEKLMNRLKFTLYDYVDDNQKKRIDSYYSGYIKMNDAH